MVEDVNRLGAAEMRKLRMMSMLKWRTDDKAKWKRYRMAVESVDVTFVTTRRNNCVAKRCALSFTFYFLNLSKKYKERSYFLIFFLLLTPMMHTLPYAAIKVWMLVLVRERHFVGSEMRCEIRTNSQLNNEIQDERKTRRECVKNEIRKRPIRSRINGQEEIETSSSWDWLLPTENVCENS